MDTEIAEQVLKKTKVWIEAKENREQLLPPQVPQYLCKKAA